VSLDEREAGRGERSTSATRWLTVSREQPTSVVSCTRGRRVGPASRAAARARPRPTINCGAVTWAERLQALAPLPSLEGLPWAAVAPFVERDKKRQAGRWVGCCRAWAAWF